MRLRGGGDVRVKMLTRAAGPDWRANVGGEIDLPLEIAMRLISGGYAIPLEKPAPFIETAAIDPVGEQTVMPKAQKRKQGVKQRDAKN